MLQDKELLAARSALLAAQRAVGERSAAIAAAKQELWEAKRKMAHQAALLDAVAHDIAHVSHATHRSLSCSVGCEPEKPLLALLSGLIQACPVLIGCMMVVQLQLTARSQANKQPQETGVQRLSWLRAHHGYLFLACRCCSSLMSACLEARQPHNRPWRGWPSSTALREEAALVQVCR